MKPLFVFTLIALATAGCNSLDDVEPVSTDICNTDATPISCAGADLSGAMLDGRDLTLASFPGADFTGASLVGADLRGADFVGADFTRADLRDARVNLGRETEEIPTATALAGAVWTDTICPDGTSSADNGGTCGGHLNPNDVCESERGPVAPGESHAEECGWCLTRPQADCQRTRNSGRDLRWAALIGADLRGARLADADLTAADLRVSNLKNATLRQTELTDVQWEGAVCPDGTVAEDNGGTCGGHLSPHPFERCSPAPDADCSAAFLPSADLRWARMPGACMQRAEIIIAELRSADLSGVDLRGAKIDRVEFEDATLEGALVGDFDPDDAANPLCQNEGGNRPNTLPQRFTLTDTTWENTICPDGTNSDDNGLTCGGHLDPSVQAECDTKPAAICPDARLDGADLRAANLRGATLTGAMLSGAILDDAILEETDLDGAFLDDASMVRAFADGIVLTGADLRGLQAQRASMRDAQFPMALGGSMRDDRGFVTNFSGADLSNALFGGVTFTNVSFVATTLADADFNKACLAGANLSGADLSRALLVGAGLRKALLIGARLNSANAVDMCLSRASLQGLEAHEALLRHSDASLADLTGAVLVDADWSLGHLEEANFTQAVLRGADFGGANLRGADFGGAVLGGADMRCADLREVKVNNRTRVDGLDVRGAQGEMEFRAELAARPEITGTLEDAERDPNPACNQTLRASPCQCVCVCPGAP